MIEHFNVTVKFFKSSAVLKCPDIKVTLDKKSNLVSRQGGGQKL